MRSARCCRWRRSTCCLLSATSTCHLLLLQAGDLEAAYPKIAPEIAIAKRLLAALGRPVEALILTLTLTFHPNPNLNVSPLALTLAPIPNPNPHPN